MEKIIWAGFSIALFAAVLTVTKRKPAVSDRLLSAWLFLFAIDYCNLGITALASDYPFVPSSFFLFNPAFYLYAKSLTDSTFSLRYVQLLHLLPYVFFETIKFFFPFSLNIDNFFVTDSVLWLRLLFGASLITSLFVYNLMSIGVVLKHRINLKNIFSNISGNQKITWLLVVVIAYLGFVSTVVAWGLFGFVSKSLDAAITYNYTASWLLIFILGFYGIKQEEIFSFVQPSKHQTEEQEVKYKQSNLSEDRKAEIKNQILQYFLKEKPYLNSDFNMPMLSTAILIPKHQVTEVLNTNIGKNFFQFVNDYRVEAVKEKLQDTSNDHLSIEAIGYDCGFSSKSSFFAVFKAVTGQTPLTFRQSVRNK